MLRGKFLRVIIMGAFAVACLLQIGVLARAYIRPIGFKIWDLRSRPAWERAAVLLEGDRFAGHIGFIRQHVPDDGRVILPPLKTYAPYEHVGFMQYFLFPRDVHNCGHAETEEACVRRMGGETTYIIGLDYFPPREAALETKKFLRYQDELGVFAPRAP